MKTNWLALAEATTLLATLALLAIFLWVYYRKPKEFSVLWIVGWGFYALRLVFGVWNSLAGPAVLLSIAYYEASALSSLILLQAVWKDANGTRFRLYAAVAFAAVSAWIVYSAYAIEDIFWVSLPTFLFFGAVQILTGYFFLYENRAHRYMGGYIAGWGFILWGLHKLDYPFMRPVAWFAPIGYIIGAFLSILVGIGIIALLFERSEEREKRLASDLEKERDLLLESEERFKCAMDASRDGIWDTNVATGRAYCSPAYFAMLGYSANEIPPQNWIDLVHPEDRGKVMAANRECIENILERFEVEIRMKASDGSWKWIFAQGKAVARDARGRALRLAGTHTDITERKRAEEEIRQLNATLERRVEERARELRQAQEQLLRQQKLAILGQVAGGVGHELRNPLGVISNAVYFLKMAQADASPKIREYLDLIERHIHISEKIVADLLNFTGESFAERGAINISHAVRQTLERFPAPEDVEVALDLPADLPQAYADTKHVVQILGNLVLNAYQAMPRGGILSICCRALREENRLMITVKDAGAGISPEDMEKLFEPLFTTKAKGVGLGLAVGKKLAEANGGRIEFQSEPGKGSAFILHLPCIHKEET